MSRLSNYSLCMIILLINLCNSNNFTNIDVPLPISAIYSICAIWNDTLYVLNGQIGLNYTSSLYNYNKGLYTLNLLSVHNYNNNTQWQYTKSNQLPTIDDNSWQFYEYGLYTPWQSYTQIDHLIYSIAPETAYSYNDYATALLIYDLSKQIWIDSNTYSSYPSVLKKAVCVTHNNTHIFGIGGYISNENSYNDNNTYSQIYNIINNSWTLTSSMHITLYYTGCSYSHITHYIYSFGGAISSTNDTNMILKYNLYTDLWTVSHTTLPDSMVNLYCYEMQLKYDNNIYCMHGEHINEYDNSYDYIMKFNIITETIVIIDYYDLLIPISTHKYPVYGFLSAVNMNQNQQYATLYVIGGGVAYDNNHYYFGAVQSRLFDVPTTTQNPTTIAPTPQPTVSPTITTVSPTNIPTIFTPTSSMPTTVIPTTIVPTLTNISYSTIVFHSTNYLSTTTASVIPPDFFDTTEGTLTLIVIGLCITVVIIGVIVYVKSESEIDRLHSNKLKHKKETEYFNLPSDFDTFKL